MDTEKNTKWKSILAILQILATPEFIRAMTPMFLGSIGLIIGFTALVTPNNGTGDARLSSAFGLAGTAIAGAAGLAQGKPDSGNRSNNSTPPF